MLRHVPAALAGGAASPNRSIRRWRGWVAPLGLLASAAALYTFGITRTPLGASEAYSALAAGQPTLGAVIQSALRFDPGKPALYHVALHYFGAVFGYSELSLRGFSVLFALGALVLVYLLGLELFGERTALAAAVIWAFNPLLFVLAPWARMYTMFVAAVLAELLVVWRVRLRPSPGSIAALGVLSAAMIYTHLCGALFAASAGAIALRDLYRGRPCRGLWMGLGLGALLTLPLVPVGMAQMRALLFGHWIDWIGVARQRSIVLKIATGAALAALGAELVFGRSHEHDDREPVRFSLIWLIVPLAALGAGSILIRPMLEARYVAPAAPALAMLIARGLAAFSDRVRNLAVLAIAETFVVIFIYYQPSRYEPWRDIARMVAQGDSTQPIFFESGFVSDQARPSDSAREGFPEGYFRVPFDHYYHGANPRITVDPFEPAKARALITREAHAAHGAWLISGKSDSQARAELPQGRSLVVEPLLDSVFTRVYRIVPRATQSRP